MADKPVVLPRLTVSVADTHAHLDMLADPALAIANAAVCGIGIIATVVDLMEAPEVTFEQMPHWLERAASMIHTPEGAGMIAEPTSDTMLPAIRVIVGIHPHSAEDWDVTAEAALRALAVNPLVVGIGETGLDFHYDRSPREDQREAFRAGLELCHELRLPATVHLREAHDEGLAILREVGVPAAGCIIHCFTEGPDVAEAFLDLDCHISFAGPVTFSKGDQMREAAKMVPSERMLVETDCPFLAPAPYRGRPNEPAFALLNIAAIAEARGEDPDEVAAYTTENARAIFRLDDEFSEDDDEHDEES